MRAVKFAEEERLRASVNAFSAEFFSLPPAQRRAKSDELLEACQSHPPLKHRLSRLSTGLDIDLRVIAVEAPRVRELGRLLCDLHVLRPPERAERRRAALASIERDDPRAWAKAARRLRKAYPPLARIDSPAIGSPLLPGASLAAGGVAGPLFLDEVAALPQRPKLIERRQREATRQQQRNERKPQPSASTTTWDTAEWGFGSVCVATVAIAFGLFAMVGRDYRRAEQVRVPDPLFPQPQIDREAIDAAYRAVLAKRYLDRLEAIQNELEVLDELPPEGQGAGIERRRIDLEAERQVYNELLEDLKRGRGLPFYHVDTTAVGSPEDDDEAPVDAPRPPNLFRPDEADP
ncbi:MAG: hypothetical protein KY476_03930 [Planctomycetes bacterium]|nr:hypothetical protein [Planctomycetota bacterium]